YNNVCNLGDEIRTPHQTMPRAIVGSILLVVTLYLSLSTVILGTVPWRKAAASPTIASDFIAQVNGPQAALVMTGLILFVTAASLFSVILGYSRVPYAAAQDGQFFKIFARVHPKGHFPHISLLTLGGLSLPFCFLSLDRLISWLILVQILSQFIWQCAGVILLRRYRQDLAQPFVMWLYPLPALLSLGLWIYVFASAPRDGQVFALAFLICGLIAFRLFEKRS
ncbi:amino acid permease, partial [bacterium]|nr:amino acid permease [bacterium]